MSRRELLRVEAKVEVEFKSFDQFYGEYTKNISKGGIFIKTRQSLPAQTVLEILLKLPGEKPLFLVGEVVHCIDAATAENNGWEPGLGVHFVDFEDGDHQAIEQYVARHHQEDPVSLIPDRRRHERVAMRLRVRFPSLAVLQHDYSEDISRGGRRIGDQFLLTLVHPDTGVELELPSEVVRSSQADPGVPGSVSGMALRFVNLTEETSREIEQFLGKDHPAPGQGNRSAAR